MSPVSAPGRRAPTRSEREHLLQEAGPTGPAFCRAHADLIDRWFADLLGHEQDVAVVALGGYARREQCPASDVDVLLLHRGRKDVKDVADRLWYPLWDAGLQLGHSVRTVREALSLADGDLETATALLDGRLVAGDPELAGQLVDGARTQWRRKGSAWLDELWRRVETRHERHGEVAYLLEPDLKESKGGLRDVHALRWAAATGLVEGPPDAVSAAFDVLLGVRVELHRRTGRPIDQLHLQEQDAIAAALGHGDADVLMAEVSSAARTIAYASDDAWRRWRRSQVKRRRRGRPEELVAGVALADDEVHLTHAATLDDPAIVLRVADAAVHAGAALAPDTLQRLAAEAALPGDPWPDAARNALVSLLGAGHAAIPVLEALDQHGLLVRLLPEWEPVRHRPQRNAYHRFTVDRHLWEAAANAASLTRQVNRPDLLLVGALLHDIGKGRPGDHTEVGMQLVRTIATRMGFPPGDVDTLVAMVEHHLLLPDVATRRDLDDPATLEAVAAAVGDVHRLELLDALTEADSLATGPAAWGRWKAGLVRDLVARTATILRGEPIELPRATVAPEHQALVDRRELAVLSDGNEVTVVAPDRPGLFSRVAGVLALRGFDILSASGVSTEEGMAVERFVVEPPLGVEPDWARVAADIERALAGRMALEARLEERVRTYGSPRPSAPRPPDARVLCDNDASRTATVIEVRAPDAIGVLYRITRALADCDLDVRSAKVQTLGHEVVDTFYVRDADGNKVTDPEHLREVERAVLAALARA